MKKCRRYDDVVIDLEYKCVLTRGNNFFFVTQLTNTSSGDDDD